MNSGSQNTVEQSAQFSPVVMQTKAQQVGSFNSVWLRMGLYVGNSGHAWTHPLINRQVFMAA